MCGEEYPLALGPLLGHCAHMAKERMNARLSTCDITPVQTHVLLLLVRSGGQADQRDLTKCMRVKPSTINGILDRMEAKGLVSRSVSGDDARRRLVTLNAKGAEQQTLFQQRFQETEAVIVRGFSPEEVDIFRALLLRTLYNLEEDRTIC